MEKTPLYKLEDVRSETDVFVGLFSDKAFLNAVTTFMGTPAFVKDRYDQWVKDHPQYEIIEEDE